MASLALRCLTAWTEDRATQGCDRSAVPGAETGAAAKPRFAPLHPSLRDRHESDKPSRQDAATCPAGCDPRFANPRRPKFQFTLNQYSLTHRCHILEATGESYRLKDARRQRENEADEPEGEEPSPPDSSQ